MTQVEIIELESGNVFGTYEFSHIPQVGDNLILNKKFYQTLSRTHGFIKGDKKQASFAIVVKLAPETNNKD